MSSTNPYRELPSVTLLLEQISGQITQMRHDRLVEVCRVVLDEARLTIRQTGQTPSAEVLARQVMRYVALSSQPSLRPVINATGIIVHTNLGRAPLSHAASEAMQAAAGGYSNLEYDLGRGQRGHRNAHVENLITAVTGAEAALVVNNNAAAVYLILNALAQNREVIISRSELVEIGGGFRIPDVMRESGVHLIEVGTTNRSRLSDFAQAVTEDTVALMRVHSSNYKMIGFTQQISLPVLTDLAHQHNIWVFDDIGSGALLDTAQFGLDHEPMVQESVQDGADLVLFSGDKLLGGPQAGIIAGKVDLIQTLRRFPLVRALRPDKLCLAALTATLRHYRDEDPLTTVPLWQMIAMSPDVIQERAVQWQAVVGGEIQAAESAVGGGSLPGATLPTYVLGLSVKNPDDVALQLRMAETPVIARISDQQIWLDPRTVFPSQDQVLLQTLQQILE